MTSNIEGSQILEILNQFEMLDEFYEAVDSDNLIKVRSLLETIHIPEEQIKKTFNQIKTGELEE